MSNSQFILARLMTDVKGKIHLYLTFLGPFCSFVCFNISSRTAEYAEFEPVTMGKMSIHKASRARDIATLHHGMESPKENGRLMAIRWIFPLKRIYGCVLHSYALFMCSKSHRKYTVYEKAGANCVMLS